MGSSNEKPQKASDGDQCTHFLLSPETYHLVALIFLNRDFLSVPKEAHDLEV